MISMWTGFLQELPIEVALQWLAETGFSAAEFSVNHDRILMQADGDSLAKAQKIGEYACSLGVPLVQMHAPMVDFCSPEQPEAEQILFATIERAAAMGVKWLVVHPGHNPAAGSSRQVDQAVRSANLRVFTRLVAEAERCQVGLAVENMTTYSSQPAYPKMDVRFGQSVADLLFLMEEIKSPWLGICWDTGHAQTQKIDQGMALREIGPYLRALHLADNDGTADSHWLPLRGSVPWQQVFTALRETGYSGPTNFEIPAERRFPVQQRKHVLSLARELADYLWSLAELRESSTA